MGAEIPPTPWRTDLVFFGRVTASVTHELNNVLSTLAELCGLVQDSLPAGAQNLSLPPEKLRRIAERLEVNVGRGAQIVKRLNRFAHTVDEPRRLVDLGDALLLVVALAEPFARRRAAMLQLTPAASPVMLHADPFLLVQAVFLGIERALSRVEAGQIVAVRSEPGEGRVEISITFGPTASGVESDEELAHLDALARRLGGEVLEERVGDHKRRLVLELPMD